ncbi:hypothetical protein F1520_20030 [Yersinia pestis]|uniref:Uncharacterized protein n=1 Tax=Yersinia pestis TaxID=632 RepID=Q8CLC2_YERPE|nr:hypothetical [Yersinia pestis KIM10+]AKB87700.1 hypothetical protein CH44_3811 [Yersinia pestis]AKT01256.1 hypothetical protein M486_3876 [Yersinia pestis 1045]QFR84868.1 hypothetical protein DJY80_08150 [Yersinia pestis subsp. pestis bv. Medievalis]KAA5770493.1 hypothetical protein F1520_20030 [Yersinia pestis]
MDVFTASLRSACSLRRGHFVNSLIIFIYYRYQEVTMKNLFSLENRKVLITGSAFRRGDHMVQVDFAPFNLKFTGGEGR